MAKWGEGDPRWIVEERPDATNVNNWHWVEKDATDWSKRRLKELLEGLKVDTEFGWWQITELTKLEGEASANNRKGKLIIFYEWLLQGLWIGMLKDSTTKIKGTFEIPNLSDEHRPGDIDVTVTVEKSTEEAHAVKEMMLTNCVKTIQDQLARYITDLQHEYGQGIILPSKHMTTASSVSVPRHQNMARLEIDKVVLSQQTPLVHPASDGVSQLHTSSLSHTERFRCRPEDIFRALTVPEMVRMYAGSDAVMEAAVGGSFALMGGNVTGQFLELTPHTKICMRWRIKKWPKGHHSVVMIDLTEQDDGETDLILNQKDVPSGEVDRTLDGWSVNFWERIKLTFGFHAKIF